MKFLLRCCAFLLVLALAGCGGAPASAPVSSAPPLVSSQPAPEFPWQPQQVVGLIECPWVLGVSALDAAQTEAAIASLDSSVTVITTTAENAVAVRLRAEALLEDGAQVLIVSLPDARCATQLIDLCADNGVALIFTGAKPDAAAMQSYDKCWYIGMLCEQTGELLGEAVAADFRDGVIPDLNGDDLLQLAWLGGDTAGGGRLHHDYALQSCADMGVFTQELFTELSAFGAAAGQEFTRQLLERFPLPGSSAESSSQPVPEQPEASPLPEAVLCADAATARGAAPALKKAGVYLACVASDEAEAKQLQADGVHVPAWFARDQVAVNAARFAYNALNGHHATLDTPLYLDALRQTLVGSTAV